MQMIELHAGAKNILLNVLSSLKKVNIMNRLKYLKALTEGGHSVVGNKARWISIFTCTVAMVFAQNYPQGFSEVKLGDIFYPTAMAFAPDGRIFATEKGGKVKVVKNGAVLSTPFYQVQVNELNERGLGGICLDPDFANNHFVYIYYTTASDPIHNRLSRVKAEGDVAVPGSEVTILDFEPSVNSIHNGGGMVFGPDGKLYLGVGNDNIGNNSQDLSNYKGKVIRINKDGSVPAGNPFGGSPAADRIWVYGLRNPWTLALQPNSGKIFANDVGELTWEEINDVTMQGSNFGWPAAEGPSTNPAFTNPVFAYKHGAGSSDVGCAISGGTFFNPQASNYPAMFIGKYFYIDYCGDWINYLDLSAGAQKFNFASSVGGANNYIRMGPDGNLYYFSIKKNALYKIIFKGNPTNIAVSSSPNFEVLVFPNPSEGDFSVVCNKISAGTDKIELQIHDLLGELVYKEQENVSGNLVSRSVKLPAHLANGIYNLRLAVGSREEHLKLFLFR
jgi:glucose/arabinose dehydrogenase